mmetsp:Transcript_29858/g.52428  ORF Transcript_29858/g.52428 Transcript_29858/m.52428 type:complete len:90 (+) Transcript_29858:180-449(+)
MLCDVITSIFQLKNIGIIALPLRYTLDTHALETHICAQHMQAVVTFLTSTHHYSSPGILRGHSPPSNCRHAHLRCASSVAFYATYLCCQ